jgi:PAS domain S-box-containing protein
MLTSVRKLPLAPKLVLPIGVIGVLASGLAAVVLSLMTASGIRDQYAKDTTDAAAGVRQFAAADGFDTSAMRRFIAEEQKGHIRILEIRVYRVQGAVVTEIAATPGSGLSGSPTRAEVVAASGTATLRETRTDRVHNLNYAGPLTMPDAQGVVAVSQSLAGQDEAIFQSLLVIGLVCAGAMLLGLATVWLVLDRFVVRRVRRMAAVASVLATGNLDVDRLGGKHPAGRDEIAMVAEEIDQMVAALRRGRARSDSLSKLGMMAVGAEEMDRLLDEATRLLGSLRPGVESVLVDVPLETSGVLVVNDLKRVGGELAAYAGPLGAASAMAVAVVGPAGPEGTLIAYSLDPLEFTLEDTTYMYAVASILRTARVRLAAESGLRSTQRRLQSTFTNSPAGILFVDEEGGTILEVSPSFCAMLGYRPDELAGKPLSDLIHPDDLGGWAERFGEDGAPVRTDARLLTTGGQPLWVDATSTRVREVAGEPGYIQTIAIDINERKLGEQTLQTTLNLLRRTGEDRQRLLASLVAVQDNVRAMTNAHLEDALQALTAAGLKFEVEAASDGRTHAESVAALRRLIAGVTEDLRAAREGGDRAKAPTGIVAVGPK